MESRPTSTSKEDLPVEDSLENLLRDVFTFSKSCSKISPKRMEELITEALFENCVNGKKLVEKTNIVECNKGNVTRRQTQKAKGRVGCACSLAALCIIILGVGLIMVKPEDKNKMIREIFEFRPLRSVFMSDATYSEFRQNFLYMIYYRPARMLGVFFNTPSEPSETYRDSCILANPFYQEDLSTAMDQVEPPSDECRCQGIASIYTPKVLSTSEDGRVISIGLSAFQPLILRGKGKQITEAEVEEQLTRYRIYLGESLFFSSNLESVQSMKDLGNASVLRQVFGNPQTHIIWSAGHIMRTSIVRRLFPLDFLGNMAFANSRVLLIDGSRSISYDIPDEVDEWPNVVVYAQGWGARRILLVPRTASCRAECVILVTHVRAGDLLFYNSEEWKVRSENLKDTPSFASLAFVSHYSNPSK